MLCITPLELEVLLLSIWLLVIIPHFHSFQKQGFSCSVGRVFPVPLSCTLHIALVWGIIVKSLYNPPQQAFHSRSSLKKFSVS